MGGCATKPKVSKSKAADKPDNEPPPESKKGVMVVMEAGDYSERVKEIVGNDSINENEHGGHQRSSFSFLFDEVEEAKKEVKLEAGDYSERVNKIIGDDNENDKVDKDGIHKRRSLRLLLEEVKEAKKEVTVEAGVYCERVKEIVSDEDDNDEVNKRGTHKRRSLSILFDEVKEEVNKEVTIKARSERAKEITGDDDNNNKVDKHGIRKRRSLSLLFEELKEAKKEVINTVDARDDGKRVKEIIGDDDFIGKIDEHGTHKRDSLSLLFKEEGKESSMKDKEWTDLAKQARQSCKGDSARSNLAIETSEAIVEVQLAFAAGDAAQEEYDETQEIDAEMPKLVRKSKQMKKIDEEADEYVEVM